MIAIKQSRFEAVSSFIITNEVERIVLNSSLLLCSVPSEEKSEVLEFTDSVVEEPAVEEVESEEDKQVRNVKCYCEVHSIEVVSMVCSI